MAEIVTVANQKGGVGKTTTVVNLAYSLSLQNKKVLILDFDPQGNASSGFGATPEDNELTAYNVLLGDCNAEDAIKHFENVDLIPSNVHLSGASFEIINNKDREFYLKKALSKIQDNYDYILIDTPPSLGILTINSLVASQSFLIPVQSEYYALEGLTQLLKTIKIIQERYNKELQLKGVVLTMYDPRTRLSKQVYEEVKSYFNDLVYESIIPRNISLSEAPSFGKPCYMYDSKSNGSLSYLNFAREFIKK